MKMLLMVLAALAICLIAGATSPAADDRPIAFTHAVIIDGSGNAPLEDGTLVVRGSSTGRSSRSTRPPTRDFVRYPP